mmetsp:Transcript_52640/g.123095  ORF Transcript_52640/g.123095 Transcript_52640/m.123095 type:complete len:241 (-) Transcript_52640:195-917(-)
MTTRPPWTRRMWRWRTAARIAGWRARTPASPISSGQRPRPSAVPSWSHTVREPFSLKKWMRPSPPLSTPASSGPSASTPSVISRSAARAGPSAPPRPSLTAFALLPRARPTSSSPRRSLSPATRPTTAAAAASSRTPGLSSSRRVSSLTDASRTTLALAPRVLARPSAPTPSPGPPILSSPEPRSSTRARLPSSRRSLPVDPSRLRSPSTLTSSRTRAVSTSTPPPRSPAATPSRWSVGA